MTCRDFERIWSTHAPGELPPAAHAHLSSCPDCAALARADGTTDAFLCQFRADRFAVPVDLPREAIDRALEAQSRPHWWIDRRRPLALATAGLAAAAVVAVLVGRAPRNGPASVPLVVASVPSASGGGQRMPPLHPPRRDSADSGLLRTARSALPDHASVPSQQDKVAAPADPAALAERELETEDTQTHALHRGAEAASQAAVGADLLRLNDGRVAAAQPYLPPLVPPPAAPLPLEERKPGSLLLDDLLNLNPVQVAGLGDAGMRAAAQTLAAEAPATDPRLQQKVWVHATREKLADLLASLSKATGVILVPRMEVAGERVSLWADDATLMEVMREIRHLHGYFWSRAKQGEKYVYSLWQDAQSRAQEEAELQRQALEQHRQFEAEVWKHVKALNASPEQLKQIGQDDPYLIAQLLHPTVRNAYRLFALLSPDQQMLLTKGQTPSFSNFAGGLLEMVPPPDYEYPRGPWITHTVTPKGDIARLTWDDMTPEQQRAAEDLLRSTADWIRRPGHGGPDLDRLQSADPKTITATFFRWGNPGAWQGMSLRLNFDSGGKRWGLYTNFAVPPDSEKFYNDLIRKGEFRLWSGAQEEVNKALGGSPSPGAPAAATKPASDLASPPDPVLDAPLSFTWTLPLREDAYRLNGDETVALLHRTIARSLIADGWAKGIEQRRADGARFHWEKRPLRDLLQRFFPGWQIHTDGGAIFLHNPDYLRDRAQQLPPAVEDFLEARTGMLTPDDMALLARSLTPWQVTHLQQYLPFEAMDELLAAQELLELYGELAPAQRSALASGMAFSELTPPQQRLFLQFAQRQRPYVEPWRFQQGGVRLTGGPLPYRNPHDVKTIPPVARMLFQARFGDGDLQSFPVDLYSAQEPRWNRPLSILVGKPFPFPTRVGWSRGIYDDGPTVWEPALADSRLRDRPLVIAVTWPAAEPYAGTQPAPDPAAWSRALARDLQGSGVTVVHVGMTEKPAAPAVPVSSSLANEISLYEPGNESGTPFGPKPEGNFIFHWPSVVVVDRNEVVRATFTGSEAWDTTAVERAARALR
jgi:hypothetical protein